ncbi:MAG: BglII/BstYI family type II restriction endonuclease [Candidatus Micrarchaeaceae archaeon]
MVIAGLYSFNKGREVVEDWFPSEWQEIGEIIASIRATDHKTKVSRERTMRGRMLYNPRSMNSAFRKAFETRGWKKRKVRCEYSTQYYCHGYAPILPLRGAFREIDFVKNRVGVEVQFGKYAFMVYNVCAKMTIFHRLDIIDVGVEIVPVKELADEMSTGVSYFEQSVWDLEKRGVANIDIPVLILGIAPEKAVIRSTEDGTGQVV